MLTKFKILIPLLFSITVAASANAETPNEMIRKSDKLRSFDTDISFVAEVQDFKGANVQTSKYKVFNKGTKMSLVETIFPERQTGRKLLMKDEDLWLFTPDIKRPTRVSMQQRLTG
jgi:outer membrane lipoprotein-sorting protein